MPPTKEGGQPPSTWVGGTQDRPGQWDALLQLWPWSESTEAEDPSVVSG